MIDELKNISLSIYNDYINRDFNKLKIDIEKEQDIYNSIEKDRFIIQDLLESITTKDKINNFLEDIRVLINGSKEELINRRIIIKLFKIKLELEIECLKSMNKDFRDEINIDNSFEKFIKLLINSELIKKDFIYKIYKEIDDLKYRLAYLFPFIEVIILNNSCIDNIDISDCGIEKSSYGIDLALTIKDYLNKCNEKDLWNSIFNIALSYCDEEELLLVRKGN